MIESQILSGWRSGKIEPEGIYEFLQVHSRNSCFPGPIVSDVFGAVRGEVKNFFGNAGVASARFLPSFPAFDLIAPALKFPPISADRVPWNKLR
jgi:hypothetical protein